MGKKPWKHEKSVDFVWHFSRSVHRLGHEDQLCDLQRSWIYVYQYYNVLHNMLFSLPSILLLQYQNFWSLTQGAVTTLKSSHPPSNMTSHSPTLLLWQLRWCCFARSWWARRVKARNAAWGGDKSAVVLPSLEPWCFTTCGAIVGMVSWKLVWSFWDDVGYLYNMNLMDWL